MPEAAQYPDKARQALREARAVAGIELAEAAGRAAYLATFHAAQGTDLGAKRQGAQNAVGATKAAANFVDRVSELIEKTQWWPAPPLTWIVWPVMKPPSSLTRNRQVAAISSTCPCRPSGMPVALGTRP